MKKLLLLIGLGLFSLPSLINAQNFDVYVSDAGNFNNPPWQILKFDQNGENGEVFISNNLAWPQDIVFLEDKNEVLISNLNTGTITKYKADNGTYIGLFANGLGGPTRMKIGTDDLLYVLQWAGNGLVQRYNLAGDFVGSFTTVGVGTSIGMDWDSDGNLYVSSFNGRFIQKFGTSGQDLGKIITTNLAGPTNIWFDENDILFVLDYSGSSVKRFDKNGNYLGVFISNINNAEGVDFLENGDLLIGEGNSSSVKQYSSTGNFTKNFVSSGTLNLKTPNAVVIRNTEPVSVDESISEIQFVTPSIGNHFTISITENTESLNSVQIFNNTGEIIHSIVDKNMLVWDASKTPSGTYIIVATFDKRRQWKQKIVVSN